MALSTYPTPTIARNCKAALDLEAWRPDEDNPGYEYRAFLLGTVMALDPCGRFHHMLSPNGITRRCIDWWESLERQLEKRGMSLGCPWDNDPCDVFVSEYRFVGEEEES